MFTYTLEPEPLVYRKEFADFFPSPLKNYWSYINRFCDCLLLISSRGLISAGKLSLPGFAYAKIRNINQRDYRKVLHLVYEFIYLDRVIKNQVCSAGPCGTASDAASWDVCILSRTGVPATLLSSSFLLMCCLGGNRWWFRY